MIPTDDPVQIAFRTRPPAPRPGVMLDLVYHAEKEIRPAFWTVRMYRSNLNSLDLNVEDTVAIHNWVSDIMIRLRAVNPDVMLEIFDRPKEG